MTELHYYAKQFLEVGASEVRIYNSPLGLIAAVYEHGHIHKQFVHYSTATTEQKESLKENGFIIFPSKDEWAFGDVLRSKANFKREVFTNYTNNTHDYFYHKESAKPLKSKLYIKAPEDN